MQVAASLLGSSVPIGSCAARILLFVGGPCTEGSGKVVNRELTEEIRSHKVRAGSRAGRFQGREGHSAIKIDPKDVRATRLGM